MTTVTTIEHLPVLLRETIEILRPRSGGRYVDGTLGGGGHAEAILEASSPDGELLGIDWDEDARDRSAQRLARFAPRLRIRAGAFGDVGERLHELGWEGADGIL
ncbi:MAG: 16S rRNA (cytosine(1402)-N(4))-methyltransferase, partial [Candidatus Binatia bacterium]